jgi:hypothetical protein
MIEWCSVRGKEPRPVANRRLWSRVLGTVPSSTLARCSVICGTRCSYELWIGRHVPESSRRHYLQASEPAPAENAGSTDQAQQHVRWHGKAHKFSHVRSLTLENKEYNGNSPTLPFAAISSWPGLCCWIRKPLRDSNLNCFPISRLPKCLEEMTWQGNRDIPEDFITGLLKMVPE